MVKTLYIVTLLADDKFELRVKHPTVPSVIVGPGHPLYGEISGSRIWEELKGKIPANGTFEIEL